MESKIHCEFLDDWDLILSSFPKKYQDIYFTKKYLNLYESHNAKALCLFCREGDKILLFPYLRGEVGNYFDFETAYGYGGPVSNTEDVEWNKSAFDCIHCYLKAHKYLCGFTRFHPLFSNERFVSESNISNSEDYIQVFYDRPTIAIDTSESEDNIWNNQLHSNCRSRIRKAEKNFLEYKTEYDFSSYEEFIELYLSTMRRVSADLFYFFDKKYFSKLKNNFKGSSFLGTVRKEEKLISAAIFLYSEQYGHYHLGGSDGNYLNLGANNFLFWKAACEMHKLGIQEFHLGGGTNSSPDNSLFKFKKTFSKKEKQFFIGKQVFDQKTYMKICQIWQEKNPTKISLYGNRLLKYRY
ncbi:MAG: GNAT family N-acetyltransferase [Bacteroidales bacterium]|nr:GNAT family N-acetyltransferase [Bacteroidales bacterium]